MKAWELLSDINHWTHHEYARTKDGNPTTPCSNDAESWCATGAIIKCYAGSHDHNNQYYKANQIAFTRHGSSISTVNDELGYDAVMAILRESDV